MIDLAAVQAPEIDYQGLSPLFATVGGAVATLLAGLISGRFAQRVLVPLIAAAALLTAIGLTAANWEAGDSAPIIEGALAIDALALFMSMLFYVAGLATVLLSLRADVTREAGSGEYMALLLGSISGMVLVAGAENLVTLFVGFELLSIPLYILCAGELKKAPSLEAGLKYLVVGSVGSATLLYGLALIYGATGSTDFAAISGAIGDTVELGDPLLLTGVALASLGLAFYGGKKFPAKYQGGAFAGQHGSWNRSSPSGYKVVFVPFKDGKPTGEVEDFLTGFMENAAENEVYGRPVGVAVAADGSLLVADDSGGKIWRIVPDGGAN